MHASHCGALSVPVRVESGALVAHLYSKMLIFAANLTVPQEIYISLSISM